MKVHLKHGKVTQNMHGASRNYKYVWDVSTVNLVPCASNPPPPLYIARRQGPTNQSWVGRPRSGRRSRARRTVGFDREEINLRCTLVSYKILRWKIDWLAMLVMPALLYFV